jgi:hypothetical protein
MSLEQKIALSRLAIALLERNLSEEEQRLEALLVERDKEELAEVAA